VAIIITSNIIYMYVYAKTDNCKGSDIKKIKSRMLLFCLKNGKWKIRIIAFIAGEICSWLLPWLAEKTEMLYVYGRVTAENVFLCICVVHWKLLFILFNYWLCVND